MCRRRCLPPYGFAPPDFHLCDQKVTIISLAFSIGPRLAEIVGLDVGDVFLPDRLVAKLKRFWRWKRERGEDLSPAAPLFASQSGRRISKRRVQFVWATWQRRAGFDRAYGFHSLRHSAVTNVFRAGRDLFLAQRFVRHVSPPTTVAHTHPSD
jgi:site-specific recombinase XerC